jgi:hypothetical protein
MNKTNKLSSLIALLVFASPSFSATESDVVLNTDGGSASPELQTNQTAFDNISQLSGFTAVDSLDADINNQFSGVSNDFDLESLNGTMTDLRLNALSQNQNTGHVTNVNRMVDLTNTVQNADTSTANDMTSTTKVKAQGQDINIGGEGMVINRSRATESLNEGPGVAGVGNINVQGDYVGQDNDVTNNTTTT